MASRGKGSAKSAKSAKSRKSGSGGAGRFLLGFVVAIVLVAAGLFLYTRDGDGMASLRRFAGRWETSDRKPSPIAAVAPGPAARHKVQPGFGAAKPGPTEPKAQPGSPQPSGPQPSGPQPSGPQPGGPQRVAQPPFGTSEDVFEAGAHLYRERCASCHGTPAHVGTLASTMNPPALQLWKPRARGTGTGASSEQPGVLFGQIANGIPQSGMPAYRSILTDTQMWQVALLLKNADQPLPDPVLKILNAAKP